MLQGVFEYLHSQGIKAPEPVGLQVMVQGVVPLGEARVNTHAASPGRAGTTEPFSVWTRVLAA